jgi:uncharacterized membrane protein YfcA
MTVLSKITLRDAILMGMIVCYLVPIVSIASIYQKNGSVSKTIAIVNKTDKRLLLYPMMTMCILSILYECIEYKPLPFFGILSLCIGIAGVIFIDESKSQHYLFAILAFIGIILYCFHCSAFYPIAFVATVFILVTTCSIVYKMGKRRNIFWEEVILLILFAFVYLYKHSKERTL